MWSGGAEAGATASSGASGGGADAGNGLLFWSRQLLGLRGQGREEPTVGEPRCSQDTSAIYLPCPGFSAGAWV